MQPKYAVHPGYVTSISDGDRHFISAGTLAKLYGLRPHEYKVWSDRDLGVPQEEYEKYEHLGPRRTKEEYDQVRDRIAAEREIV